MISLFRKGNAGWTYGDNDVGKGTRIDFDAKDLDNLVGKSEEFWRATRNSEIKWVPFGGTMEELETLLTKCPYDTTPEPLEGMITLEDFKEASE